MTTDQTLVRQSLNGTPSAFEELIDRYDRPVYNAALQILRDPDDARDAVQSAFVKAYEKLNTYDPKYRFFSWIYKIVCNESKTLLQRRRRHEPLDHEVPSRVKSPEEECGDREVSASVQAAIQRLSLEHRLVIVLRHFGNLSYREMSYALEIPEKTVRSRLYSARQKLCALLLRDGFVR